MPTPNGKTTVALIEGKIPDVLLDSGRRPAVDASKEYLAGGGSGFPLMQQVVLARGGDDLSADLGIGVYDAMDRDSTVRSALGVLLTGILGGEFQVLPAIKLEDGETPESVAGSDPGRAADVAEARWAADFCKRSADRLTIPLAAMLWDLVRGGLKLGCKLAEKVFAPGTGEDDGLVVWETIRPKRRQAWDFVVAPSGAVVAIRGITYEAGLADLPPEKFLILSWMEQDGDPRGQSILRGAYNGWNLKVNTWPKLFKYLDKFGTPSLIGTTAPDAPDEPGVDAHGVEIPGQFVPPTVAMGNALDRFTDGSYCVVRAGSTVEILQASGNGEAFHSALNIFKQEILEGILLSAHTVMEAQRNSKAQADQAQDTVGQLLRYGRGLVEGVMRRQGFHQLLEINKGREYADKFTPTVSLGRVEHQDVAGMLTALAAVGYALAPSQFPAIDARNGFPVRRPDQEGDGADGVDREDDGDSQDPGAEFSCARDARGHYAGSTAGGCSGGGGGGGSSGRRGKRAGKPGAPTRSRLGPGHVSGHGPSHPPSSSGPDARSKFIGQAVGKREHVFAERQEKAIAKAVGGKQLKDNEPLDVRASGAGGGEHAIEVKSLLKGKKRSISVHDDALLRKVDYAAANPHSTFHTVVMDHRGHYERGAHAEHYSGHDLYYRRGSGAYALGTMHKVKDHAELKRLIDTPDHLLPEKARGSLPSGAAAEKLRASAERAHESRLRKDRARKARLRGAGQTTMIPNGAMA